MSNRTTNGQKPANPEPKTLATHQSVEADNEYDGSNDEIHNITSDWSNIELVAKCYFFIIGGFLMTHNMNVPLLPKIFLGALSVFSVIFVCWMLWRVLKSIYIMYQYSTPWAITGIVTAIFGVAPLLIGIFYFQYELEYEDKEYIKQMFVTIGLFIAMSIFSSLVLPPV